MLRPEWQKVAGDESAGDGIGWLYRLGPRCDTAGARNGRGRCRFGYYRDGWLFNDPRPRPLTLTKDIRQLTAKDVQGFDAVVHLAELSNDPLGEHDAAITFDINHRGSVNLAEACKAAGVPRFVYTSSCSV